MHRAAECLRAGALWGAASIPRHWRDQVAWGDEIAQTARDLLDG